MSGSAEVVLLGTSGGPRWRRDRTGIASAVVVGDAVYLVDCGYGVGRQMIRAGFGMDRLRGIFVTHMHSDHTVDFLSLLLYGWYENLEGVDRPVTALGPGDRGTVPPASPHAVKTPPTFSPQEPTPGLSGMARHLMRAYATDINDRLRDNLRRHPDELLSVRDIELPGDVGFHPDTNPCPPMRPFDIYEDDRVRVTATLVQHSPIAPAYAFRFDTDNGSVTFSGDTGVCNNLLGLASDTDVLVHEVIDEQWVHQRYENGRTEQQRSMIDHHLTAHTSIPDTGRVAEKAGARTLALNHFVPGELETPRWHTAGAYFSGNLVIGQDLHRIPLGGS
ncbi:MBL fold metallo-hydrolase [Spinactinospora alkalitolerans]